MAVNPIYYEEETSADLIKLVNENVRVEFVDAKKVGRFRLYGDISLRAFSQLKLKAIEIIKSEKIDCMWVPIPPFYTALIGRKVHDATSVPYVVDYIDPWVHEFPGSHSFFSRAKMATLIANLLEPIAVKKVAGFTGVSSSYYEDVFKRNPHLKGIPHKGMPYGFDPSDYNAKPQNDKLLWSDDGDVIPYIYAGAFLPKAHYFIDEMFKVIAAIRTAGKLDNKVRFYFVGTNYGRLNSVMHYATLHGISDIITEKNERIPYLEVLNNLTNAFGVLAIGSTEMHYTASKIFQALLSRKPVFALFHHLSSVISILQETKSNEYLVTFEENEPQEAFEKKLYYGLNYFLNNSTNWNPDLEKLNKYAAKSSASMVADVLNEVIGTY